MTDTNRRRLGDGARPAIAEVDEKRHGKFVLDRPRQPLASEDAV